jgi:serine/threonine protein kinase/Tfp pilus assembly protein PilF
MIGRTISRYHVVELLGAGGMGVVYEARDTRLGRAVALKFISEAFAADPMALRQFEREAQTASSLNHPHICTVYQVDEFEGRPFIAMELLRGGTLTQRMGGAPLGTLDTIDFTIQIADALDAAHEKGIVHRDVKPANIFISDRDVVKLLDFGLAKHASVVDFDANASSGFTAAGRVFGTANYMSPERLLGHAPDHRSDLFSLGAVVYEMATASQPFRAASAIETIDAILHDQPRWDWPIPPALKRLIKKLLEKNPDNRYQSAKAVMNALLEARAQLTEGKAASPSTPPTSLSRASIAVLSFRNLANNPEIEYFCDGLAEELITALTKVEGVRVAARTSTFTFKGKDVDIHDVGERLKVNAVLDGSVRKTGNGIRVSCQLLNTEDGYELWSEQYDRELAEVLMLQEDITRAIVDKLKVSLVEHLRPNRRQTESKSAYHHYLKGRFYWSKRYEGGLRTAREEFERAIADDPEYALAYSGLADTLVLRGLYSLERPRDVFVRAEKHVAKALSIESRLAEAHTSLALILLSAYWDWVGAENEFLRATELDPMEAQAHTYYSWLLAMLGRHWEAGVAAKRAQDIDPLSPLVNSGVAWMYFVSRDYDRAIEESLKCLEVDPNFLVGLYVLGLSYLRKGAYAQASPLIERATVLSGRAPFYLGLQGLLYAEMDEHDKVVDIISDLDALRANGRYVPPHCYVYIYAALKDFDRAFEWQEKACEDGAPPYYFLSPLIDCLQSDERHKAHLARMRRVD